MGRRTGFPGGRRVQPVGWLTLSSRETSLAYPPSARTGSSDARLGGARRQLRPLPGGQKAARWLAGRPFRGLQFPVRPRGGLLSPREHGLPGRDSAQLPPRGLLGPRAGSITRAPTWATKSILDRARAATGEPERRDRRFRARLGSAPAGARMPGGLYILHRDPKDLGQSGVQVGVDYVGRTRAFRRPPCRWARL